MVEAKVDTLQAEKFFEGLPRDVAKAMKTAAATVGKRYLGYHRAQRMRGVQGAIGIRGTRKGLQSHFRYEVEGETLDDIKVTIGTKSRVALEFEEGRKIVSKQGRFLLVPLPPAVDANGRVKKSVRNLLKAKKLFILRSPSTGRAFLAGGLSKRSFTKKKKEAAAAGAPIGHRSGVVLYFILKKDVQEKKRLEFFQLFEQWKAKGVEIFTKSLRYAIAAAARKRRAS